MPPLPGTVKDMYISLDPSEFADPTVSALARAGVDLISRSTGLSVQDDAVSGDIDAPDTTAKAVVSLIDAAYDAPGCDTIELAAWLRDVADFLDQVAASS